MLNLPSKWLASLVKVTFAMGALAGISTGYAAARSEPTLQKAQEQIGKLVLPWVPNAGQWDERAAFRTQSFAGSVWVTKDGTLVHQFNGPRPSDCADAATERIARGREAACPRQPGWVLTERFVGGMIGDITGRAEEIGRVSYSVGPAERHAENLPSYGLVDLGEVYPGVRVELKANQSNVEKLYTVAPGGDPGLIRMAVDGAQALSIGQDGSLIAQTGNGGIAFTAPIAFQEINGVRKDVAVRYALDSASSHYSFQLAAYDRAHPLVIDPLLQSTYLGGGGSDYALALAIHPLSGEVYIAGYTNSTNLPRVSGGPQITPGSSVDAFVTRFNTALTSRLQSSYLGGAGSDFARALAIHPLSGEVYVAGYTNSTNLPGVSGGVQASNGAGNDAFITRFNAALTSLLQSTYLGGAGEDDASALAIDPVSGEVYVAGSTNSTNLPGVAGGAQATNGAAPFSDAFVTRFNATLTTLVQSSYLGGGGNDIGTALVIHPVSGEVYIAGSTGSTNLPGVAGGAQASKGAGNDAFVTRFNAALTTLLQSSYLGGGINDAANALAIHPVSGEVYIAGRTNSSDLPGVAGGAQVSKGMDEDAFVTRFNATLTSRLQSTYLGGSGIDIARALAIHPVSGEVYVTGSTASTNLPGVAGGAQASKTFGDDVFVTRFNAALTSRGQSTYLGGSIGSQDAFGIAIHPLSGEVYIAGWAFNPNLPGAAGGAQAISGGLQDAFVSRFSPDLMNCALDSNGDGNLSAANEGLLFIRTALGFSPASAVAGTTTAETQWTGRLASQTSCPSNCRADIDGDAQLVATKDGLVLLRAMLGMSSAAIVADTGISEAQWLSRRTALIACGNTFP